MKAQIIILTVFLTCLSCAYGQWEPDPFCPYPYPDYVTRYPYYGNCSVYWECWQGSKYVMECPQGTEFYAALQRCDSPAIAQCDPFAETTANPNTPPIVTTSNDTEVTPEGPRCPYPSEELVYFPVEDDCTQFWECFEGNRYLYTCPTGLWWHQSISECDEPGTFCSYNGTTITIVPTTESGQDPRCIGTGTSYYPVANDCSKFVQCVGSNSYILSCPEDRYFDAASEKCLTAAEADCCQSSTCD